MQVFEPGPDQLALWTRPNRLMMALGALLILLGLFTVIGPGKATTLTLQRDPPGGFSTGEIRMTNVFREYLVVRMPLRFLAGAMVDVGRIGGRPSFYHLDLDVRDGQGGLYFAWYANHDRVEADAAAINAFVADKNARLLVVRNDKRPLYFPLGGLLAFTGATLLLWSSLGVKTLFDRPKSSVTIRRHGLLGTNMDVIPFAEIQDYRVAGYYGDCQLYLQLHSGRRVTLGASSDMQNMIGPRRITALRLVDAERIRAFCEQAPATS